MSWQEASGSRPRESQSIAIAKAHAIAKRCGMSDHPPHIIASETFEDHSTANIRVLLGLKTQKSRVFCCLVFEKLEPITTLTGRAFWKAYWDTIKCHYVLWEGGVQHGDISVSNLMHRKGKGVLNDYDLCRIVIDKSKPPPRRGHDRTGSAPFMALDLLTKEAWDGKVERLYRHDLESFYWALLWICACFNNGEESTIPARYRQWLYDDYGLCFDAKMAIVPDDMVATGSYQDILLGAGHFFNFWNQMRQEGIQRSWVKNFIIGLGPEPYVEPTARQFLERCLRFMHSSDLLKTGNLLHDVPTIADISRLQKLVNSPQT